MKRFNKLIIACDGESASGKSTAAKLISKKYGLLLINSGLIYRYGSKLIIEHKPKNQISFLNKKLKNISYKLISNQKLHSEKISNHVAILAKNKRVREIVNKLQRKIIKKKVPLKDVKKSLGMRTQMDKKRKNSPLIKVKSAILIRTDKLNKKQVLSKMSKYIEKLN